MERPAPDPDPEALDLVRRGAAELGAALPPGASERLARLAGLLARWSRRINLTAHATPGAIVRRLILDALALDTVLPPFADAADLGSGAGFPGLPLAIRHPERRLTLVEPRERRHHFQRAVVRELGLENVAPLRGRAEELDPLPHDAAVAQALARPGRALGWILPWARPGGLLVLPGGERPPEPGPHPEVSEPRVLAYRVPLAGPRRTVWIARRRARR